MPLYEYECKACGVRFERRQSITDDAVRICPECGGEVRRVIRPAGVIFKGKGFYATDNRKAKPSKMSKAASGAEPTQTWRRAKLLCSVSTRCWPPG
jgi:putative FmdB family regulatory protein